MKNLILLNDNTEVKLGDTGTKIRFKATNNGTLVALKDGQSATFRIKNNIGFLKSINADTIYNGYGFEFDTSSLSDLVAGDYQVELAVTQSSDDVLIFPDEGYVQFKITDNALSIIGEQLPQMSLEAFKNEVNNYVSTKVKEASTELTNNFQTYVDGITDSTTAVANQASKDAQTAISTADNANNTAATAQSTSEAAATAAGAASTNAANALSILDKLGGRNYLLSSGKNTGQPSSVWVYTASTVDSGATYLGSIVSKVNAAWSKNIGGYNPYNLIQRGIYNTNDNFVYSVYVKKDPNATLNSKGIAFYSSVTDSNGVKVDTSQISDVWSRISVSFKFNVDAENVPVSSGGSSIRFEPTASVSGGYLYFASPKLEKGVVPTDYTPAPEDYELSTTQQQISMLTAQLAQSGITSSVVGAVDFNTYTNNGKYSLSDNSATNAPASVGTVTGILEVTAGGGNGVQRFFDTSADLMFWRTWSGSTFHSWKVAANDSSIITPASD